VEFVVLCVLLIKNQRLVLVAQNLEIAKLFNVQSQKMCNVAFYVTNFLVNFLKKGLIGILIKSQALKSLSSALSNGNLTANGTLNCLNLTKKNRKISSRLATLRCFLYISISIIRNFIFYSTDIKNRTCTRCSL